MSAAGGTAGCRAAAAGTVADPVRRRRRSQRGQRGGAGTVSRRGSGQRPERHGARTRRTGRERTGVPCTAGGALAGNAALGTPGAGGGRSGSGGDVGNIGRRRSSVRRGSAERPGRSPRHGNGLPGRRQQFRPAACTNTANPALTAGPGCSGVPSSGVGAGGGAPLGRRCRWGRGTGTRAGPRCARTPRDRCRAS